MPDAIDYEPAAPAGPTARSLRRPVAIALLVFGGQLWLLCDPGLVRTPVYLVTVAAVVALGVLRPTGRVVAAAGRWLGRCGSLATPVRFVAVAALSAMALYAIASGRPMVPAVHDEFSYLLQARMVAEGRLWMPPHPLAPFFDTFYVITDRAYASQYFPGAALAFGLGLAAGVPFWVTSLALCGAACGAAFLVLRELFDGAAAVAGVVAMIGVLGFRYVSVSAYAQPLTLVCVLLAIWLTLRWDCRRRPGYLVTLGVIIGLAAVTRPFDALVFGLCCAALVAWRLRGAPRSAWGRAAVAGLLPLAPFIALQLVVNHGVTGRWMQTPFGYYAARDMPGTGLGFRTVDPTARPASAVPQKQLFYTNRVVPLLRTHTPAGVWGEWRSRLFRNLAVETLADVVLVMLIPAGVALGFRDARRTFVAATMPVWWLAYAFHPFTFFHYYVVLIVPSLVVVFAGLDAVSRVVGGGRRTWTAGVLVIAAVGFLALPWFRRDVEDQAIANPAEVQFRAFVRTLPADERAIVLVRFAPPASPEAEVVYNVERAWPDDCRIVRAHDLGDTRDAELFRYYAARQPGRVVYRFDRPSGTFARLGPVSELAAAAGATTRDAGSRNIPAP